MRQGKFRDVLFVVLVLLHCALDSGSAASRYLQSGPALAPSPRRRPTPDLQLQHQRRHAQDAQEQDVDAAAVPLPYQRKVEALRRPTDISGLHIEDSQEAEDSFRQRNLVPRRVIDSLRRSNALHLPTTVSYRIPRRDLTSPFTLSSTSEFTRPRRPQLADLSRTTPMTPTPTPTITVTVTATEPTAFTNVQTASALIVTRNVTSTNVVTAEGSESPAPTAAASTSEATTAATPLYEDGSYEDTYVEYDYKETTEEQEETTEAAQTEASQENALEVTTTTSTTSSTTPPTTTASTTPTTTTASTTITTTSSSTTLSATVTTATVSSSTSEPEIEDDEVSHSPSVLRMPRIIESRDPLQETDGETTLEKVFSGQYHEELHGSSGYHLDQLNIFSGAYNEELFSESKPKEEKVNEPAPDVEVKQTGNTRVYNVESKVDDFIIGEYGTINEDSGLPMQGVRYTALADDSAVNPELIRSTLAKFFGFS